MIAEHQQPWPVCVLCEVWEVGRSGVYDDVQRCKTGGVDAEEMRVVARIQAMHAETGQSDGSRRMAKPLQDEGFWVGRWKARRLRQQAGVSVRGRSRRRPHTTDSRHGFRVAANLLERQCDVDRPNAAWCGDITYLWTEAGWVDVSVLVDWYARTRGGLGDESSSRCDPGVRMPCTWRLAAGVRQRA